MSTKRERIILLLLLISVVGSIHSYITNLHDCEQTYTQLLWKIQTHYSPSVLLMSVEQTAPPDEPGTLAPAFRLSTAVIITKNGYVLAGDNEANGKFRFRDNNGMIFTGDLVKVWPKEGFSIYKLRNPESVEFLPIRLSEPSHWDGAAVIIGNGVSFDGYVISNNTILTVPWPGSLGAPIVSLDGEELVGFISTASIKNGKFSKAVTEIIRPDVVLEALKEVGITTE